MKLLKMITVEEDIRKNSEFKKSDLDLLKDWLKKQPHLPTMSDPELMLFLHSNYYRTEPTKITIDTFFTFRTHVPELFTKRDPLGSKELREIMKVVSYIPLPGTTPDGYKVMLLKITNAEPHRYVFLEAVKLFCMAMELWLYTSAGSCHGHIVVFDMTGIVFGHLARVSPVILNKCLYYLQDALPVRLKAMHFINAVPFVDLIVGMMKPFMKKELSEVLFIHTGLETLRNVIPIDILPNDQGGKAGPLNDLWEVEVRKFEEHRAWFQEGEKRWVNEAVRPDKEKNAADLFGIEGSFKKLEID